MRKLLSKNLVPIVMTIVLVSGYATAQMIMRGRYEATPVTVSNEFDAKDVLIDGEGRLVITGLAVGGAPLPSAGYTTTPASTVLNAGTAYVIFATQQVLGFVSGRVAVVNTGSNAITASQVQFSHDSTFPASAGDCTTECNAVNVATFNIAGGSYEDLGLSAFSNYMRIVATSTSGTTVTTAFSAR